MAEYRQEEYFDGTRVNVCLTQASDPWTMTFFLMIISAFFLLPLLILIILYTIIAKNLISKDGAMYKIRPSKPEHSLKARKQVVFMLGAVVLSFFLCLLPFRILTLWIILAPDEKMKTLGLERYYNILYFCRIMLYLNSAINPILYNLMSSKFRKGFKKVYCCCFFWSSGGLANGAAKKRAPGTLNTTTTSSFLTHSSASRKSDVHKTLSLDDLRIKETGLMLDVAGGGEVLKWSQGSLKRTATDTSHELRKMAMKNNGHQKCSQSSDEDCGSGDGVGRCERLIRPGRPFRQTSCDDSFSVTKGQRRKLLFQYSLE